MFRRLAHQRGPLPTCRQMRARWPRCTVYVVSKHGVNGLTKTAGLEYAKDDIRVNAAAPGNVETPMIKQYGEYADVARATQPTGRCSRPE